MPINLARFTSRTRLLGASIAIIFGLLICALQMYLPRKVEALSSSIVISQVYGGGGNTGAPFNTDFVELFNRGNTTVSVAGWSIQYTSATGTGNFGSATNLITPLSGSLAPGQYLLIHEANGATGVALPAADVTDASPINMSGTGGKVALVNTTTPLGCNGNANVCSAAALATIVDLVGWDGANYFEGSAAPATTNTTAVIRNSNGCAETDNNAADFTAATPTPRNTASTLNPCGGGATNPSGVGAASPTTVAPSETTLLTVTVTPGANPTSAPHTVTANLSAIGGSASQTFFNDGTNGDVNSSDNIFSYNATVANNISGGLKSLPFTITEIAPPSRTGSGTISLTVLGSTNPSGTGAASPNTTQPGGNSLLTVTVTPGTNPTSSGLAVTGDLSSIGGSNSQQFFDDGSNGDTVAGNNVFSYNATIDGATTLGPKVLPVQIADAQGRSASTSIALTVQASSAPAGSVVISQIYGGGGNTGSTLKNDYIELINHSSSPVNLSGWSVQAWAPGTSTWEMTPLTNFTLQPGQYYLVQESQGAGGTTSLPTPDAVGTIAVSSTSTKVVLVNNTTLVTGICPNAGAAGIVDLIGYGATDCFEGAAPAPTLSNTTAALRRNEGCFDTNQNANDVITGSPSPRNSSTPFHDCTSLSAYGTANPSSVLQGGSTTLTVYVAAGQNPDSSGVTVTADLSQIGGSATQSFSGSGSVFTFGATVPVANSTGMKSLPVTVTDIQGRITNTNILVSVLPLVADHVTISQVYGGGGNSSATYTNDYVELYNPTANTVTITGWSLQYASAAGTSWTNKQPLGGIIGPGEYYLVQLASGGANGAPLPVSPNISGDINISAATGKIALVNNSTTLTGDCPLGGSHIVDFVGYGGATCHEGTANAPAPSNSTATLRKNNGSLDSDQNGTDFQAGAPNPRRTATIVELGPWVSGTDPGTGDNTIPYDATVTVNFSEPVTVDPGWYNINCSVSGAHNSATEAHFSDLKTYAVTPNVSFQFGEQCTVTIPKTSVHDVDADDSGPDTDSLFEDYTWSFTVVAAGQAAPYPSSVHLTMGDPGCGTLFGCAAASTGQPDNYLMEKPTYSLSYNRDKGTPNWVSWHLDSSWYGTLARVDTFRPDPKVDPSWYRVQAFDYSGSGFDRGHMTPNADRDNQNRVPINQETYLMSNMVPQAPGNNQGPWAALEGDLRTISDGGNELYIISGPLGVGGSGSNGGTTTTIANGNITVPASTWKVALILPKADGDDTARVTCSTRTIAVLMPNQDNIRLNPWQTYLTTVDNVEQQTGFDFFSNLPPAIQACIEAGTNGNNPPGTSGGSISTAEDNSVNVTLNAVSPGGSLTYTIVTPPAHGQLTGSGANRSYAPDLNFNGADSFTFKVNDGSHDSNTSTISISVTEVNDSPTAADDSASTNEDTPLNISTVDLTTNDSAGPGEGLQSLTVTTVTQTADTHGSVALNAGIVTYTPDSNYHGPASFTYQVCDNGTTNGSPDSQCATATVNVTVNSINDNPEAVNDSTATNEDNSVTVDVVANDTDVDGDARTLQSVGTASHGSVTIVSGQAQYSPNSNFNGSDSFTYVVSDGQGGTATGTVSVTVNPVNDAPAANSQAVSTPGNAPLGITLTGTDLETASANLNFVVTVNPAHGALTGTGANRTYTPAFNYTGPDSFKFTVTDTGDGTAAPLTSSEATVSITVNDTINPTVTAPANLNLGTGPGATSCSLFISDATLGTATANDNSGVVSIQRSGVPAGNIFSVGTTIITYTATDGAGNTAQATQTVVVTDNTTPTITLNGNSITLTPPNHSYHTVNVSDLVASASDNCDANVNLSKVVISKVTSDEAENGDVDGNTTNDIVIAANCKSVQLRAERQGTGDGRVYTITFRVTDQSGNATTQTAKVNVLGNGPQAIDSGVQYTVNGTCP